MHPSSEQNIGSEASIPRALRDLWLRFHEKDLCQDLDSVFVFHQKGLEVWCRVEDEKSYQRFSELIEPLRPAFEIDVYATRPTSEKKFKDDDDPPPSLWNNDELQIYLQDTTRNLPNPEPPDTTAQISRRMALKQRLVLWAAQILGWNKKLRRYAADLPDLARLGYEAGAPDIKAHAAAVCLAHAQALERNAARLVDSLTQALPRPEKASRRPAKTDLSHRSSTPVELATLATAQSQEVANRIYRFIYPQDYTVGLTDLKEPDLLESLHDLRTVLSDLQRISATGH